MAFALRTFFTAIIMFIASSQIVLAADYCLAPGDVLTIGVWGHKELQVEKAIVRPDGKVSFPLVGEIQASGNSTGEFIRALTNELSDFVKEPRVTVNVEKFHTTRIYVLGEVAKPGMYEIEKQHNLLDAITAAGGYTKDAAKKKVMVLKSNEPGKAQIANVWDLLNKADMTQNYPLADGDVVFLSNNGRVDLGRDILPYLSAWYYAKNIAD